MSQLKKDLSRRDFIRSVSVLAGGAAALSLSGSLFESASAQAAQDTKDPGSIIDRLKGPLVPIMPAYTPDNKVDLTSTCNWINWLIERGIKLFWITPGTTRFKTLKKLGLLDDEIRDLTRAVAEVTKGRATFIACTPFHWDADECIRFTEDAQKWGVDIVKITCNWNLFLKGVDWKLYQEEKPSVDACFEKNRKIAEASPLPLFTYALPGFSLEFFKRILDLPQFVGIKNDSGNYKPHTKLLRIVRQHDTRFCCMTGGSMKPYLLVHPLGATAFADIRIAGIAPHLVIRFSRQMDEGKSRTAAKIVQDYEEPLRESCKSLSFRHPYREILHLAGHFKSSFEREPQFALPPEELPILRKALTDLNLL